MSELGPAGKDAAREATSMNIDLESIFAIALGIGCLVGLGVVIRRLWLAATNPALAYLAGRRFRRGIETAAHTAGRASGAVDGVASVVSRSFHEGRDAAKGDPRGPRGGA